MSAPGLAEEVSSTPGFAEALRCGLRQRQKAIPSRFFYDEAGSRLFEEITRQPEYYPTRTEIAILGAHRRELGALTRDRLVVEPGSGSSRKTELLFDPAGLPAAYVPVDISRSALAEAAARLVARYPGLTVLPVVADLGEPLRLPAGFAALPRLGFFPGSTIGNFPVDGAVALLRGLGEATRGGPLIVGVDMPKAASVLEAAYDDGAGVTARFNLNLLVRANRELGCNFDLDGFAHRATWNGCTRSIDMWLVSRRAQRVDVLGSGVSFAEGEAIHTETSRKYAPARFIVLARRAGWRSRDVWFDSRRWFSVHVLEWRPRGC